MLISIALNISTQGTIASCQYPIAIAEVDEHPLVYFGTLPQYTRWRSTQETLYSLVFSGSSAVGVDAPQFESFCTVPIFPA